MADSVALLNNALAGRYTVERELGAGGMATVYLARDVKHDRRVALKVLRPELAAVIGAERFLSEIKTTANLQHPHILPLFDSGTADGQLFYVMPYVEGETLRGRLDRETQLPVGDAIRLATEVAGALEYAHKHGVVHRDIKPENILLQDGGALVADFGIALAVQQAGGERMTQTGMSLGTPHYMSPEQAMGQKVIDARSDIYALGAVAYEMLIGEPPFTGPTAQAIVAKVMTESPKEITAQRRSVPLHVADTVAKALEKLPADRFASAKDFADALKSGDGQFGTTRSQRTLGARDRGSRVALWSAIGVAALSVAALAWSLTRPATAPEVVRFRVDDGPAIRAMAANGMSVAVSADGKSIAYISKGDSLRTLLIRRIGEMGASPLAGTRDLQTANGLHYSADGRWLSMNHNGRIVRLPAAGGPTVVVAPRDPVVNNNFAGLAVMPSGEVVYVRDFGIRRAVPGSASTLVAAPDSSIGETAFRSPMLISGGGQILFTVARGVSGTALGLVTLDGNARRTFELPLANPIAWLDGWLLYGTSAGEINAVRFDPTRGVTGDPITVLAGAVVTPPGAVIAALSPSGTLAYLAGESDLRLALLDGNGVERRNLGTRGRYYSPTFSPDARQLAFSINDGLWVHDIDSDVATPRTAPGTGIRPAWTPDGKRIAYIQPELNEIWWMPADGSGPPERLFKATGGRPREVTFTPDGRHIVMRFDPTSTDAGSQSLVRHIYMADVAGGTATPLITTPNVNQQPAVSPDGRWLAYASNETGSYEVYVRALSGGARVLISAAGATEPKWVGNTQLVYRSKRSQPAFLRATLSAGANAVSVVRRDSLFADPYLTELNGSRNYDISRDGRFAVTREPGDGVMLIAVVNWVTELRAKLKGK